MNRRIRRLRRAGWVGAEEFRDYAGAETISIFRCPFPVPNHPPGLSANPTKVGRGVPAEPSPLGKRPSRLPRRGSATAHRGPTWLPPDSWIDHIGLPDRKPSNRPKVFQIWYHSSDSPSPSRSLRSIPTMSCHPRAATRKVIVLYQTTQAQMRRCQKVLMPFREWRRRIWV